MAVPAGGEAVHVISELVFETQSKGGDCYVELGRGNEIVLGENTQLGNGDYQLFLEGRRMFSGLMMGKGIANTIEYFVDLRPASFEAEEVTVALGKLVGSARQPEIRRVVDLPLPEIFTSLRPGLAQQVEEQGASFKCAFKLRVRGNMAVNPSKLRIRLVRRRVEALPGASSLPDTFDPLSSNALSVVETTFGHARPDVASKLLQIYKESEAYHYDNLFQARRVALAKTNTVWWPKEGEELWSERTRMAYSIRRKIGEGAYGIAFLCADYYDRRYVAKASKTFFSKQKVEEEWRRETKLMLAVQHPNIVQLYDAFTWSGLYWVVMEECEGSFASYLTKVGKLSADHTIEVAGQLLSALEHIHSRGIIHRDVQMDNVLYSTSSITGKLVVKLTDFGISKFIGEGSALVSYSSIGRAYDMPPETAKEEDSFSVAVSDVYQLGLVMYTCYMGRPAISENDGATYDVIQSGLARKRAEAIGNQLGGVIASMLRRRVEYRPTSRDVWLKLKKIRANAEMPWSREEEEMRIRALPGPQPPPRHSIPKLIGTVSEVSPGEAGRKEEWEGQSPIPEINLKHPKGRPVPMHLEQSPLDLRKGKPPLRKHRFETAPDLSVVGEGGAEAGEEGDVGALNDRQRKGKTLSANVPVTEADDSYATTIPDGNNRRGYKSLPPTTSVDGLNESESEISTSAIMSRSEAPPPLIDRGKKPSLDSHNRSRLSIPKCNET